MPWWGWIIIGGMLLGTELAFVDLAFYLVFIGLAAITVGLLSLGGLVLPPWGEWLLFAALSLAAMVFFRGKLYRLLRPDLPGYEHKASGENIQIPEKIEPGATCRVEHRGTSWTARNDGDIAIGAGEAARIERIEGLVLVVSKSD